jgi:hypothetical protein
MAMGDDSSANPLAEPIAALLGATLALISLLVPLLTVMTDPSEAPAQSQMRITPLRISSPAQALSRP